MNKETITRNNEKVALLLEKMNRLMENMESLAENYKPVLGGERFLTDKELSGMLKVVFSCPFRQHIPWQHSICYREHFA
jgi:hypothetical protein